MQTITFTGNEMPAGLPKPVAIYVAAEKAKDTGMLALCFTDDARVHDESHDYRGLEAIRNWKQEANAKYRYTMDPLKATVDGDTVTLLARLTGNFPGSPIDLDFVFTLTGDKIVSLEI